MFNKLKSNLGYTIDQTILIVAVIAILITLIIASVGWDLLQRTGGTKLASQAGQIEQQAGAYFGDHRMWPSDAITQCGGTPDEENTLAVLQIDTPLTSAAACSGNGRQDLWDSHQNRLPGFAVSGGVIQHDFGGGGNVYMDIVDLSGNGGNSTTQSITRGQYYVVEFEGIPVDEALEANEAVDGNETTANAPLQGHFTYRAANAGNYDCAGAATAPAAGARIVDVCYVANVISSR